MRHRPEPGFSRRPGLLRQAGESLWPTLHRVGLTPRRFQPNEYAELLALRIGLTDLCKAHSGNDDELPDDAFDVPAFVHKVKRHQPRWVAFTSKNAAQAFLAHKAGYGAQPETIGVTQFFVLPSPSGQATRFWDEQVWHELAAVVKRAGKT